METISQLLVQTIDTDFKAEVVAAELIDNKKATIDNILLLQLGALKRSFRKDIESISDEISTYNNKEYTLVNTHKEGIYDMLPQGLFHIANSAKNATTETEIIEYIKRHKIEERNARKFFLPFEAGINQWRIVLAMYESRLDKASHYNELIDVFKNYWKIFKYLNTQQSYIFIQILPIIHEVRDDFFAIQTIFKLIFNLPIRIETNFKSYNNNQNKPLFCKLDTSSILGVNLVTSYHQYNSGDKQIEIKIGPISNQILQLFKPKSKNNHILNLLCDYLLPINMETIIDYILIDENKEFVLASEKGDYNSVIGLNTFL